MTATGHALVMDGTTLARKMLGETRGGPQLSVPG